MSDVDRWWCTKSEAARRLGITYDMVRSMIVGGQLATVRVGGRDVIRLVDIEAVLNGWGLDDPNGAEVVES